ncbi:hypothetical protein NDU88_002852 [Pleurodeles waltl]|uniref:Uncharacterized protein n=1 Tax=Pleurodeles waltl TaxID=8319 RepID=A0AAV7VG75_PLEWA|nr:hypothetical protein NDU88_002852 [Pleurodeles waltl]
MRVQGALLALLRHCPNSRSPALSSVEGPGCCLHDVPPVLLAAALLFSYAIQGASQMKECSHCEVAPMARGAPTSPLGRCPTSRSSASLLVGEGQIHPTMVDSPHPPLFHQRTGVLRARAGSPLFVLRGRAPSRRPACVVTLLPASVLAAVPVRSAQRRPQHSEVGPPCVATLICSFGAGRGSCEVGLAAPPRLRGRAPSHHHFCSRLQRRPRVP